MYLAGRWANRQLSKLEMIVVVIIFTLLLTYFLNYMLRMFAIAERSLLMTSIININTTLQYRAAGYALRGDYDGLERFKGVNPYALDAIDPEWLGNLVKSDVNGSRLLTGKVYLGVPPNYLGELDNVNPDEIEAGSWYFNLKARTLVYMVKNREFFESSLPGPDRVEFYVDIDYTDRNNNNQFDPAADDFRNIRLQATGKYDWRI
jgi:hypothetical protein